MPTIAVADTILKKDGTTEIGEWEVITDAFPENETIVKLLYSWELFALFCATQSGNIYKSTDGGKTWTKIESSQLHPWIGNVKPEN